MNTLEHGYHDFNEVKNIEKLDFRNVIGSIRMNLKRLKLKSETERMVWEFLNYKFRTP